MTKVGPTLPLVAERRLPCERDVIVFGTVLETLVKKRVVLLEFSNTM